MMDPKMKNKLVLIAGGTSSGKTTITMEIAKRLACFSTVCLSMDNYYRHLPGRDKEFYKNYDFDRPEAIEGIRFAADLKALAAGEYVDEIRYDFTTHSRRCTDARIVPPPFGGLLIAEGIFALHFDEICNAADLKIFISAEEETMLNRRMDRDCTQRGRTPESVREQFMRFVIPTHRKFVRPGKDKADIVVRSEDEMEVNAEFLTEKIKEILS